jgi:hypothetical protein
LGELSALARYRAGEFEKAIQLYIAANPLKFKQPDSRVYFADALVKVGRGSEIAPLLAGLDPGWMYPETRPLLETLRAGLPAAK